MKVIATLALALVCGMVSAAPLSGNVNTAMGNDNVETGRAGTSTYTPPPVECPPPGGEAPVPEPASLALLGLGLGAAALRRKK